MEQPFLIHQTKMRGVFYEIQCCRCMTCNKIIFHYVYAIRGTDMHCCSEKCVEEYYHDIRGYEYH